MVALNGQLVFLCSKNDLHSHIKVSPEDFDDISSSIDEDRGMGDEIIYESIATAFCSDCDKEYQVHSMVSEYPIGAPNYEEYSIKDEYGDSIDVKTVQNTLSIF